ncbi:MAG TPA: DUF3395 domain-containing protein [Tepidisphaeraceae bacterium]|nr:DUF3395 domain-containing protein [Tepidisphaeraceae bacterium]
MSSSRPSFAGLLLAAALCVFAGLARSPARAADAALPKLVIVKAEFGDLANGKTADVTAKVAAMVKNASLTVAATTANLGNPAPGAKKLKVSYTIDGIYRSKTVDEGETLDISARLFIRKAVYGDLTPKGETADVTEQVADLVKGNALTLTAGNELFGDPAEGVVKRLRVDYTFDGVNKSKSVGENEKLTISDKGE